MMSAHPGLSPHTPDADDGAPASHLQPGSTDAAPGRARIAVVGAGGVGGYYGARLAAAGHEVLFVARGRTLEALHRDGLQVESTRGDVTVHPVTATDDPAGETAWFGGVDVVLLSVKTWQVEDASRSILPLVGPESLVVPLQNGVDAAACAAAVVGQEHVLPGSTKVFSEAVAPGRIRHSGGPASITFGEWDGGLSPRARRLGEILDVPGITVDLVSDVWSALWAKFLFIVPFGSVGAVTQMPVGVLRAQTETREMLQQAMREIETLAEARGVSLPPDVVERTMAFVDAQPAVGTSSMQRDIAAGRPSELEAWTGAVVRLGLEAGVATPLHTVLYHCLLPSERRAREGAGEGATAVPSPRTPEGGSI